MSEPRIFVVNAAVQVSRRLGIYVETARSMLLAAVADKKLELTIDLECERRFRQQCDEPVRHSQTRRTATGRPELDSAYAALAEATIQNEIARALPAVCGLVGQAEFSAWLDSLGAPKLTNATPAEIRDAVRAVYADPTNCPPAGKPPNLNELVPLVQQQLKDRGRKASRRPIQDIGREDEFQAIRRPTGKRLY